MVAWQRSPQQLPRPWPGSGVVTILFPNSTRSHVVLHYFDVGVGHVSDRCHPSEQEIDPNNFSEAMCWSVHVLMFARLCNALSGLVASPRFNLRLPADGSNTWHRTE